MGNVASFAVTYDNFTRKACFAGLGATNLAIPDVDAVYTGVYSGSFELHGTGSTVTRSFTPYHDIIVSPANTDEMVHVDLVPGRAAGVACAAKRKPYRIHAGAWHVAGRTHWITVRQTGREVSDAQVLPPGGIDARRRNHSNHVLFTGSRECQYGPSVNAPAGISAAQSVAAASGGCVSDGLGFTNCSYTVHPRVGTCGGFDGTIWWQDDNFGTEYIGVKGTLWSHCSAAVIWGHLVLNQDAGLVSYNDSVGHANGNKSVSINYQQDLTYPGGVSSVHMYVCSTDGGWHCGGSVYV